MRRSARPASPRVASLANASGRRSDCVCAEVAIDASARQLLPAERRMQPTAEATDDAPAPDRLIRPLAFALRALSWALRPLIHYPNLMFTLTVHRGRVRYKGAERGEVPRAGPQ
jgi:hypothetical protein